MISRSLTITALLCGLALLPLAAGGCGGDDATDAPEVIRPVRYTRALATGGARVRSFSGAARAAVETQLSFKVAGNVDRTAVKVGDTVRRGDLVAALDPSDYRLQVQEAEASLAQSQAQERNARASYDRVQALYENSNASRQDLDQARAGFESATAQVQSISRRLDLARLQVDYCTLVAPFAGSVASVTIERDENVTAGQPVALLTSDDHPEVEIAVPGALIAQLQPGLAVEVASAALGQELLPATITEVGGSSTGFATTFPVTVRLDRADSRLRPGMSAEVAVPFETASTREAVVVPSAAVGEDHHGRYLFVVEPGDEGTGVARRREVTVGQLTSEGLEIMRGVEEGELVITAGVSRIVDGQKVKLL